MSRFLILQAFSLYFLLAICVVECHPTKADLEKYAAECLKEHDVTEKELNDIPKDTLENLDVPKKIKCYSKCLLEKLGGVDKDGRIISQEIAGKVDLDETQLKKLDDCMNKLEGLNDACEYTFQTIVCIGQIGKLTHN